MDAHDYDWLRFWIHFVCGALLGGLLGTGSWLHHWHSGMSPLFWIGGCALAAGLVAGIWGDRFWESFLEDIRWFRWWI
jgi:hypothetical protein